MKCAVCLEALGSTWFSIAGKLASGRIYVTNAHPACLDREVSKPARRRLESMMLRTGWVQESFIAGGDTRGGVILQS